MAETITPPTCLCGCAKSEHRQGRKSCLKCDCDQYEPAEGNAPDALHDMEIAFLAADRELKALRAVVDAARTETGIATLADQDLPAAVHALRTNRDGARDEARRVGEELATASQRLAEYDSGASVDRLLHDADAIDLDRVRHAAAGVRTAASILGDVLATAARELELRAEADRLRAEADRVDEEIRRLVAGDPALAADEPVLLADGEPRPADVRRWAAANGFDPSPAGPIPGGVMAAYKRAHGLVSL